MWTDDDVKAMLERVRHALDTDLLTNDEKLKAIRETVLRDCERRDSSPLPDPPADLADAWQRFQQGEPCEPYELRRIDEWRADCAADAGF